MILIKPIGGGVTKMSLLLHSSTGETFEYDGENLYHFGIKGMKWGVRRYQNPDGSLTPEGKERYSKLIRKRNNLLKSRDFAETKRREASSLANRLNINPETNRRLAQKYERQVNRFDKKYQKVKKKIDAYGDINQLNNRRTKNIRPEMSMADFKRYNQSTEERFMKLPKDVKTIIRKNPNDGAMLKYAIRIDEITKEFPEAISRSDAERAHKILADFGLV